MTFVYTHPNFENVRHITVWAEEYTMGVEVCLKNDTVLRPVSLSPSAASALIDKASNAQVPVFIRQHFTPRGQQ